MVGLIVDVFKERIRDEHQPSRVSPASTIETNMRPVDTSLVLLATGGLRCRGEGLEKRGMLSWHDGDG